MSEINRRDFVRTGITAAAGAALGLQPTFTVKAGNPENFDTSKILNYNPDMEYRRCGKTNLMISAVCLGG
ncbi:MAG TPA: twin-arginine translocation signal domain-containing protein, partial [Thermogutta sp.]|nr:twin-arginine translocation signal domain-containing protein [Thermogutta sp.]